MRLFHGSNVEILQPDLSRTRPFKDFGQGFYLSADYSQALERARQVTEIAETGKPVVTEFEWDIDSSKSDG